MFNGTIFVFQVFFIKIFFLIFIVFYYVYSAKRRGFIYKLTVFYYIKPKIKNESFPERV